MKTQTSANGIMQISEYENSCSYRVACECSDPEHDVTAWIDITPDQDSINVVNVEFYIETTTAWWDAGFSRIRAAWDILVHGYRKEGHTMLLNEQTALNFADALLKSINNLRNR